MCPTGGGLLLRTMIVNVVAHRELLVKEASSVDTGVEINLVIVAKYSDVPGEVLSWPSSSPALPPRVEAARRWCPAVSACRPGTKRNARETQRSGVYA